MNKSTSLVNIAPAINQFKKDHPPVQMDEKVDVYKNKICIYSYNFASMEEIQTKIDPFLDANGLSVLQTIEEDSKLTTMLLHVSGEYFEATMSLNEMKETNDKGEYVNTGPKEFGALVTYARRYSKMAILGIAPLKNIDRNKFKFREDEQTLDKNAAPKSNRETIVTTAEGTKTEMQWLNLKSRSGAWTPEGIEASNYMKNGGNIDELKKTWKIGKDTVQELFNIQNNHKQLESYTTFTEEIKSEINKASDVKELSWIHDKYYKLQQNDQFIEALSMRKTIIQKPIKQTVVA